MLSSVLAALPTNPEQYRVRTPGRKACRRPEISGPCKPGRTTSLTRRSIEPGYEAASASASAPLEASITLYPRSVRHLRPNLLTAGSSSTNRMVSEPRGMAADDVGGASAVDSSDTRGNQSMNAV